MTLSTMLVIYLAIGAVFLFVVLVASVLKGNTPENWDPWTCCALALGWPLALVMVLAFVVGSVLAVWRDRMAKETTKP